MKKQLLIAFLLLFNSSVVMIAQEDLKLKISGIWRICGQEDIVEAETITFTRAQSDCKFIDCAETQWTLSTDGMFSSIFSSGCDVGFKTKNFPVQRWMFSNKTNILKFVATDSYLTCFEVISVGETLILKRRKDLEL